MSPAAPIAPAGFRFSLDEATGVGTLTFARPDRLNALTFAIYRELREVIDRLDGEDAVRAVVLTGEGRAFCSGGDVEDIIGELFARDMKGLLEFTRTTGALIAALRRVRKPVVAAINGTAVGAGAVIALACDVRVASASAKLGFIFPRVGLCGADMEAGYLLPRVVGLGRASELLFTGDIVGAEEALRIGLVNRVVPPEECLPAAQSLAARLASGPAFAHAMTKQMLETEHGLTLEQAIEAEAQAQALCMQHPDFRAAFDAWTAKRPIRFAGAPRDYDATPAAATGRGPREG
ncbi:MAG TPA: enoyl-CoA hydratase family protein, partial [Polyangiaceae bacterium]|nr:enoyl-CoA hydratase family protein [Polyangiaceae bacterium]